MAGGTQDHRVSLAVWDIPTTAAAGQRFNLKAGAKSSGGSDLRGQRIEIRDASGATVASGELGAAPWPGTALHWAELSLPAPAQLGVATFTARLDGAEARFGLVVVPPPAHKLTIRLVETGSAKPIGDADIRVGAYRATTAAAGDAELAVAKGRYDLHIWKAGYDVPARTLDVDSDTTVEIGAAIVPEENADRAWRA